MLSPPPSVEARRVDVIPPSPVNRTHYYSSSSSSSEEDFDENYASLRLEKFQRMLSVLVLAATPTGPEDNNPVYWAQFDDLSAW